MKSGKNIELLAPAGSFAALQSAIQAGCDAVHIGVGELNMRAASSQQFTLDELERVVQICHSAQVACYVTLNTIIYDQEMSTVYAILDRAKACGVDAIIAADMAVILAARERDLSIHISTQLSISNSKTLAFYANYADRIVLARELTLPMIRQIATTIHEEQLFGPGGKLVELEAFAHGAMCVAISGRCGMSLYTENKSANRGVCRQVCRRAYTITEPNSNNSLVIDNNFVMSPEDLCTIGLLDQLLNAGILVLKLEGRGRSPEYVDVVVRTYREALDALATGNYTEEAIASWRQRLETVYHRGLSEGFYLGIPTTAWSGSSGSKATEQKQFVGNIQHYYSGIGVAQVLVEATSFSEGESYAITGTTTGVVRGIFTKMRCDDNESTHATQGQVITFAVPEKVRKGDKVYVLRKREKQHPGTATVKP